MRRLTIVSLATMFCFCLSALGQDATARHKHDDNPRIVAKVDLYNQTGPIAPINVYTPRHSGIFSASTVIIETVACGCNGSYQPQFGLTYRNISFTELFSFSDFFPGNNLYAYHGVATIATDGGKPITFSAPASENVAGSNYDVHIVLEQLN